LLEYFRSCDDVEHVATCKETFNLYYYEIDRDEATSTFPPWNEKAFTKVCRAVFFSYLRNWNLLEIIAVDWW